MDYFHGVYTDTIIDFSGSSDDGAEMADQVYAELRGWA